MEAILDIQNNKTLNLMGVLKSLASVKTKTISAEKSLLIEEIKEAVENMKLVRQGKLKTYPVEDLLNEFHPRRSGDPAFHTAF